MPVMLGTDADGCRSTFMQRDVIYFRQQADFCLSAAKIASTSSMAADFERLARNWLKMADDLERSQSLDEDQKRDREPG